MDGADLIKVWLFGDWCADGMRLARPLDYKVPAIIAASDSARSRRITRKQTKHAPLINRFRIKHRLKKNSLPSIEYSSKKIKSTTSSEKQLWFEFALKSTPPHVYSN